MSFPTTPSSSKSGRLTRQENVVSNVGGHFRDTTSLFPQSQELINSKNTILQRGELPKPMSRLPEIRLEGGGTGNGTKGLIAQMKPQKSCESYDSTASGLSWSSQSTVAIGGGSGHGNSASVSGNLSYASYEEEESHSHKSITRIPSNPSVMHRSQYSPRVDSGTQKARLHFIAGYSFDEEHGESISEDRVDRSFTNDRSDGLVESVFDGKEKNAKKTEPEIEMSIGAIPKRKSFKQFWQRAYRAIKSDSAYNEGNSKFGSSKKKAEQEEPEEIDPVYQLLKSAATQRKIPIKCSTSFDQPEELVLQPHRLSSSSRTSSISQKDRSQPP